MCSWFEVIHLTRSIWYFPLSSLLFSSSVKCGTSEITLTIIILLFFLNITSKFWNNLTYFCVAICGIEGWRDQIPTVNKASSGWVRSGFLTPSVPSTVVSSISLYCYCLPSRDVFVVLQRGEPLTPLCSTKADFLWFTNDTIIF